MPQPTRIIFMGTGPFAYPALRALAGTADGNTDQKRTVAAVVTQPDREAGRGRRVARGLVASLADDLGIPVLQPVGFKNPATVADLAGLRPDLLIVASYGRILPRSVLALPARGALNLHPSLLPRHRGPSPVSGAILAGDPVTGVTVMEMSAKMDAGPIVAQRRHDINAADTTESLTARLAEANAALLLEIMPEWLAGTIAGQPQDESDATYTSLLSKEVGRIDWSKPATVIEREIRAFNPWPISHTVLGQMIRVFAGTVEAQQPGGPTPGTVLDAGNAGIRVQAGDGQLLLTEIQPAGGKRMAAGDFARGRDGLVGLRAA